MCGKDLIGKILEIFPCRRKARSEFRTVFIGHKVPECLESRVPEKYPSNCVISSKYTAWNFIPKNLFEQFHRIANIYFLASAIIQLVIKTSISPWTSILPLTFVVSVTAIKQGYEDWRRHKADQDVNCRLNLVVRNGELEEIRAMDIKVGDIVKVPSNCGIPCDLVLLSSSEPCGQCYITTANLDGETNLKTFRSSLETQHLKTESQFKTLCGTVECQQPIADFYRFVGRISIYENTNGSNPVTRPLGPENILLRGTRLKNTQFIFGCAIYTGQETKISLNSRYASHKYSQVERKMNRFLVVYVSILVLFAIIWESITIWFYSRPSSAVANMWYIHGVNDFFWSFTSKQQMMTTVVEDFFSYIILCNYIIPISMYVTVELQKFFGSMFFEWDLEMYDPQSDEPAKAKTSDLNEELGQVEYLFTDKTGTLTENDMQFRQCSVDGKVFEAAGNQLFMKSDSTSMKALTPELEDLFTVLALCHTVRIDCSSGESHDFSQDGCHYDYQSSSPDEKALLEACRRFGIVYHGIQDGLVLLTIRGQLMRYTLHHVLDFDANRKRMSVIVEDEDGEISLLCKGAETAIFERVKTGDVSLVESHINEFAKSGLRTLVVATRILTPKDFSIYSSIINTAKTALEHREEKLAQAYDIVENDLVLLGATAVEDRLQEGVIETISALREAGIKIWVMTGDKEETAVNVSYSAGHFNHNMHTMSLTKQATSEGCGTALQSFLSEVTKSKAEGECGHALVIDGKSLTFALEDHPDLLRVTCNNCVAVLCCRMTPLQKALVVRLVKSDSSRPITAAIGDGANDVSMIQESDVGLGIIGKEGRQAARYSDYAFGRFCFLQKALLVHGHLFYRRIAILIQYFFYKNVAMITSQLYFTFFSAFSAQTLFNGYFLMFFNLTFTALPIMVFSLVEKHLTTADLLNQPALYRDIKKNKLLSNWNFIRWNLLGVWHSLVFFFGALLAFSPGNSPFDNGLDYGLFDFGTVIMMACVITVNIKLMLETYNFNGLTVTAFVLSFASFFVMTLVCCSILWPFFSDTVIMYGSFQMILSSPYVWFVILLLTVTALLPDIILRTVHDTVFFVRRPRDLNHNTLRKAYPRPSPTHMLSSASQRLKPARLPHGANGAPYSRPIQRYPTKPWTFSDAVVDASASVPQSRFIMATRRENLSSTSSSRRLISVTSSENSPGEASSASPLMGNWLSSAASSGSYTTSFIENASSSASSQLFF